VKIMATISHVAAYEIQHQIGSGGMAPVFLATDTRTGRQVALKLLFIDNDQEGQQILEMERGGATLQEQFGRSCRYVPAVFEHGVEGPYFFIAMEYLPGRNLSEVIAAGPLPPDRALKIGIQLCEFLEAADSFTGTLDGRTVHSFLHGDLKPRNIRVLDNDEIKVFDFGIAKALSLSRKVTRNDFGSSAYMSPERIESGNIDAQAEFWAVGVLLYEMASGLQPFRALDTARLERRIRERRPPQALGPECPAGLQAVIARLLAGAVGDRYRSAKEIREELQRCADGQQTMAERDGWPDRSHDEPATRRTRRPDVDNPKPASPQPDSDDVTRRTVRERPAMAAAAVPAVVQANPPAAVEAQAPPVVIKPRRTWRARGRRLVKVVLILIALTTVLKEISINIAATALSGVVGNQDLAALNQTWAQYEALVDGSLEIGGRPLERALIARTTALAEDVMGRYKDQNVIVWESQWQQARDALEHAWRRNRSNHSREAALRYCEGQLRRIDGEARIAELRAAADKGDARRVAEKGQAAERELAAAVTAFRQAAELRPNWPDPFLGLMRTFAAQEDIERAADALAQAQRYGYTADRRDWFYLAEGYAARGAKFAAVKELDSLTRAADAYTRAIELYGKASGYRNSAQRLRDAERQKQSIDAELQILSLTEPESGTSHRVA
jgi:serine/threonine protein kinase/tetratricopeptide (TPR) repeat protein